MAELADLQNAENEQVSNAVVGAEIPEAPAEKVEQAEAPEKPAKKLTLRQQIKESVKTVRKDEAGRDPATGQFTNKAAPEKAAPTEIPAAKPDAQPEASKAVGPPPGWSQDSKAFFNSLPADHPLRKDIAKREEEVSNGFKKYADDNKRYQEIEQVLAPARSTYQSAGVQSDAEAIKRLFMWESYVRQNPARALSDLARQYGVNLSPAQTSEQPSIAGQDISPQLRPVMDQVGSVAQEARAVKSQLEQMQNAMVSKELEAFAKDKPHFDKVRVAMGQLMQAGMVTDLDAAYQRAIWADPDIRKQMLEEADAKRQAELRQTTQQKLQNAKAAAVSPAPRAPTPPPVVNGSNKPKGVRGAILQSIDELREERA